MAVSVQLRYFVSLTNDSWTPFWVVDISFLRIVRWIMTGLQVPIEEFTTPLPVTAVEGSTVVELEQLMKQNGIRHLPILRSGKVVGMVTDRDLRVARSLNPDQKGQVRAEDIMARDPVTVSAGASLEEAAFEMSEKKIGSVIVNDENDQMLGIFTVTDALNALIELVREDSV